MRTLIVYGTKHGATKKVVDMLKEKIAGDVSVVNAKEKIKCDIKSFDVVIIGSSIYIGAIRKEVKKFIRSNLEEILSRKIGLFLVSGGSEEIESYYKKNFPEELLKKVQAKGYFGFSYNGEGYNAMERMVLKEIAKKVTVKEKFEKKNMDDFLNSLQINEETCNEEG
jgi:menaquinone-dependent protoporphyrinogen oxidase